MSKMPHEHGSHHGGHHQSSAGGLHSSHHLSRGGLSFDFAAGSEPHSYQVAIGSDARNAISGSDDRDYFWGRGGNDKLFGGAESDNLFGDAGRDILVGGDGGDRLSGGMGMDRLFGGAGADALMGGKGDDYLDEGVGHGDLDGGPGNDILVGGQGPDAFMVNPMSGDDIIKDFTAGPGMFDHLALADLRWEDLDIQDTAEGAKVSWATGSVLLDGVRKADLAQDDFMFADAPDLPPASRPATTPSPERATPSTEGPTLPEGDLPGERFDQFADAMLKHRGEFHFTFHGDEAYKIAVGRMTDDTMNGSDRWDHFFGRDGDDTLNGYGGNDILQGDAGDDTLSGGDGSDKLDGGMGNDQLMGGAEEDELMGAGGADNLDAGAGHDMIEGGMGDDTIRGGTGADAFIVMPDSGHDVVLDFEARGEAQGAFDHLALMDIMPDQLSVTDTATGALIGWDTNSDGTAEGSVLLKDVFKADLRQSDFMFDHEPGFVAGISTDGSHYIFPAGA